jgi:hypothetical protein
MNNKTLGFGFIFISALLFVTNYLSAAIYYQGVSFNNDGYSLEKAISQMSDLPINLSIIALIVGIIYLATDIITAIKQKKVKQ